MSRQERSNRIDKRKQKRLDRQKRSASVAATMDKPEKEDAVVVQSAFDEKDKGYKDTNIQDADEHILGTIIDGLDDTDMDAIGTARPGPEDVEGNESTGNAEDTEEDRSEKLAKDAALAPEPCTVHQTDSKPVIQPKDKDDEIPSPEDTDTTEDDPNALDDYVPFAGPVPAVQEDNEDVMQEPKDGSSVAAPDNEDTVSNVEVVTELDAQTDRDNSQNNKKNRKKSKKDRKKTKDKKRAERIEGQKRKGGSEKVPSSPVLSNSMSESYIVSVDSTDHPSMHETNKKLDDIKDDLDNGDSLDTDASANELNAEEPIGETAIKKDTAADSTSDDLVEEKFDDQDGDTKLNQNDESPKETVSITTELAEAAPEETGIGPYREKGGFFAKISAFFSKLKAIFIKADHTEEIIEEPLAPLTFDTLPLIRYTSDRLDNAGVQEMTGTGSQEPVSEAMEGQETAVTTLVDDDTVHEEDAIPADKVPDGSTDGSDVTLLEQDGVLDSFGDISDADRSPGQEKPEDDHDTDPWNPMKMMCQVTMIQKPTTPTRSPHPILQKLRLKTMR